MHSARTLLVLALSIGGLAEVALAQHEYIFPQFTFGGGWGSTLTVLTEIDSATTCTFSAEGRFLTMRDHRGNLQTGTELTLQGAFNLLKTESQGMEASSGMAVLDCNKEAISANTLFSWEVGGSLVGEALVEPSEEVEAAPDSHVWFPADYRDGARFGVAVANPSNQSLDVHVLATGIDLEVFVNTTVNAPAKSAKAFFVDELGTIPTGQVVQVLISPSNNPGPSVYAVGLRFTGQVFTTIPGTVFGATTRSSFIPPATTPPQSATPPPPTVVEAFKLLNRATFGATEREAQIVIELGYEDWIERQIQQPESLQLPYLQSLPVPDRLPQLQRDRRDIWFRNVIDGSDQLRQRVAFALSQIMVVAESGVLRQMPYGLAGYYDILTRNAFGNFRELMEEVTLHPAMGVYLSMLGNERPDRSRNISPDENYAREMMQLFTIGLVELNIDGTMRTDAEGQPVSTYNQDIIEGFAHVFTGWNYAGGANFNRARRNETSQTLPMQLYPEFHATGTKLLLNGVRLPAGQSGRQDLEDALDNIFAHPNVGPFVAIRLIQRLVTSNPSPEYVDRVATTFNDNGEGTRGDLKAVVKSILLDPEARSSVPSQSSGKLKEPLLRLTQLWRAYDARSADGVYYYDPIDEFSQSPQQAPSVFNFFSPFYAPPGEISDAGLTAPELQIATEYGNTLVTNFFYEQTFSRHSRNRNLESGDIYIDIEEETGLADNADALVDRVAEKLLAGQISDTLRTEIRGMVESRSERDVAGRVGEAIYLTVTSPEFARQH